MEDAWTIAYATITVNILWLVFPTILPSKKLSHPPSFSIVISLRGDQNRAIRTDYSTITDNPIQTILLK
jgi:hypothetical protein